MTFRHTFVMIILICFLGSCGKSARETTFNAERAVAPVHIPDSFVAPAAADLVNEFLSDAARLDRKFVMPERLRVTIVEKIENSGKIEIGHCTRRWVERKVSATRVNIHSVELSAELLDRPYLFRRTVYHELGHCLLNLPHVEASSPRSIMSETVFANETYDENEWLHLVEELMML